MKYVIFWIVAICSTSLMIIKVVEFKEIDDKLLAIAIFVLFMAGAIAGVLK